MLTATPAPLVAPGAVESPLFVGAAGGDAKVKFDSNDFLPELPLAASAVAADTAAVTLPPVVTPPAPDAGWTPEPVPGAADPPPVTASFVPPLVVPEGANAEVDSGEPEPSVVKPAGASWASRPEAESEARGANTKPPTDETAAAGAREADAPTAGCGGAGDPWWADEVPLVAAAAVAVPCTAAGGPKVNAAPAPRLAKPIPGVAPAAPNENPAPSPPGVGAAGTPAGDDAPKEEDACGGAGVDKEAAEVGLVRDEPIVAAAAAAEAALGTDLAATLAFNRPPTDKGDEAAEEEEDVALLNTDATAESLLAPPPAPRRGAAAAAP